MAKQKGPDTLTLFEGIKEKILKKEFSPFYLLMGDEPYYVDLLSNLIIENGLEEHERDFNQYILYASETSVPEIVDISLRFPMMAQRQLVIVKEAQSLKKTEGLIPYLENQSPTTILVLCYSGGTPDKRTSFYKIASKAGVTFESTKVAEGAVPTWIEKHLKGLGKSIEPEAALLLFECAGNDLRKIVLECDKLIKSLPQENKKITSQDIERIIGISREFNITELTNAIAMGEAAKAFKIGYFFGESPKIYPIQKTLGFLFFFFSKLEQIQAISLDTGASLQDAAQRAGLYYRSATMYINAASRYNLRKTMKIISYIKECDIKSKSNSRGSATDGELLIELLGRIF